MSFHILHFFCKEKIFCIEQNIFMEKKSWKIVVTFPVGETSEIHLITMPVALWMYSLWDRESPFHAAKNEKPSFGSWRLSGQSHKGWPVRQQSAIAFFPENRNSEGIRIASGQELGKPSKLVKRGLSVYSISQMNIHGFFSVSWKALSTSGGVYGLSSSSLIRISINQVN